MKQTFKLIILMFGLLAIVSLPSCGGGGGVGAGGDSGVPVGPSFKTSNLSGTWPHVLKGSTTFGDLVLDIDGNVTGGEFLQIDPRGTGLYESTGLVSITPGGGISGNLTTDVPEPGPARVPGDPHDILDGQMSRDKGIMAIAATNPGGELGLFIKQGAGYSQSDLTGTWKFGNQNEYGTFTLNGAGDVVTGTGFYNVIGDGVPPIAFPGVGDLATLIIDEDTGNILGDFDTTAHWNVSDNLTGIPPGQMSSDKRVFYIALTDNDTGADNAYVAVKMNANFGIGDAVTTKFRLISFGDLTPVAYGSFTLDVSGNVTGDLERVGAPDETYQTGTANIETNGSITSGAITTNSTDGVHDYDILWGQVSASKNFSLIVYNVSGPTHNGSEVALLIRQ